MAFSRLAVLLSGGGTTLQNLIDRIADGRLAAQIVQVVSSKAKAFGVERARTANLPIAITVGRADRGVSSAAEADGELNQSIFPGSIFPSAAFMSQILVRAHSPG